MNEQLSLFEPKATPLSLLTPRQLWAQMDTGLLERAKEDRRVERKSVRNIDFQDLATNYSAFSNTPEGGVVVYGVENNGAQTGCSSLGHEKLNSLENFHRSLCPAARPEIRRVPIKEGSDFVVAVYIPYLGTLAETNKQEAWIRYGDTTVKMSEPEKDDFRATRGELSFELRDAVLSYPNDFDASIIQTFVETFKERENRGQSWTIEETLIDRCLGRSEGGVFKPNNALALFAALQTQRIIPGCRVRVQRFPGTVEGQGPSYNPIRDRFLEGNVVRLLNDATPIIRELNYDVTWLSPEGKFITVPEYPEYAVFEGLVNACVHRSYSFSGSHVTVKFFDDRMELESPGGFVPPVNATNIYDVRAARNPHLMDALRYLGFVQMAREGTRRMRESMNALDLPDPIFTQEAIHGVLVRVALRNDHATRKRTNNKDVAQHFGVAAWKTLAAHEITLVSYAFSNETLNVTEAQHITGRTWSTSKKDLTRLVAKGFLTFQPGEYIRDPKAHYRINKVRNAAGHDREPDNPTP